MDSDAQAPAGNFTTMANAVLDDPRLDAYELKTYLSILRRDWNGDGWEFSHEELRTLVGCGQTRLEKSLANLHMLGLVRWLGGKKRIKRYFALAPSACSIPATQGSNPRHAQIHRPLEDTESPPDNDSIPATQGSNPRQTGNIQRLSKTIKDESVTREAVDVSGEPPAAATAHNQEPEDDESRLSLLAREVAKALLEAQARPATERAIGRYLVAAREEVVMPYRGRATLAQVRACIAYMATKPFFAGRPHGLTPAHLGEELGPWLAVGEPTHYEPPAQAKRPGNGASQPPPRIDIDTGPYPRRWLTSPDLASILVIPAEKRTKEQTQRLDLELRVETSAHARPAPGASSLPPSGGAP